jgi:hypothetical protein
MSLCHVMPMCNIVRVDGSPGTVATSLHRGVWSPHTVTFPLRVTSRYALYCHRPATSMSCAHLMRCLHHVPSEVMMSLMSGGLGMHDHAWGVVGYRACGGSRALPQQEAGLEPRGTWRYRSPTGWWSWCLYHVAMIEPSCAGDEPRAVRHVVTPEPPPAA